MPGLRSAHGLAAAAATPAPTDQPTRTPWPSNRAAWLELLSEPRSVVLLTERERQAITIQYVDWPEGASNLQYMTLREMAAEMGISPMRFKQLLQRAEYKLGLTNFVPRMNRIKATTRRELYAATHEHSVCDLCQRPLGRLPLPPGEIPNWADLMEPRFLEPVSIDHIVPVANGGTNDPANLRVVHALCNMRDGARRSLEDYEEAPLGYVRKAETLPNGRGPRTWIEVEPGSAELVTFVISEYAKGATLTSIAERMRKWPRRRLTEPRARQLIRRSVRTIREYVVNGMLRPHIYSGQPMEGKRTSPYPALIDVGTADECQQRLELRWQQMWRRQERLASASAERPTPRRSSSRASGRAEGMPAARRRRDAARRSLP